MRQSSTAYSLDSLTRAKRWAVGRGRKIIFKHIQRETRKMRTPRGQVRTVLGEMNPKRIGITLMHEHTFIDHRNVAWVPKNPRESELAKERVQFSNMWWNRMNPLRSSDNLVV